MKFILCSKLFFFIQYYCWSLRCTSRKLVSFFVQFFLYKFTFNYNFQDAQQRLEENHREKVTKVMKDWSDLEERYQDMRSSNPIDAQSFKKKMTQRFQVNKIYIYIMIFIASFCSKKFCNFYYYLVIFSISRI